VSCSVHDVVRLESLGVPTAAVGTAPFRAEALEQARALGMPGYRMVEVAHPIQPIPVSEVVALADAALDEVVARLVARPEPGATAAS
jgi:hypothetical protein